MSDGRVDINRPEYSWIPFFKGLARRLYEDGWRHKQAEIVAELQRMRREGIKLNKSVDDLTDMIDPFSMFSMIRALGFDEARRVMQAYGRFFAPDGESALPQQEPFAPSRPPNNSMFYDGVPIADQNESLWDLLEYVLSTDINDDHADNQRLIALLNQAKDVRNAGIPSISGALYWIQPHRFLKTDTIDHFLGKFNYRDFGSSYVERLNALRKHDPRTFPELNNESWIVSQFISNPDKNPIWQVRGGIGFEFVEQFLHGGYTAISFGVDGVDLSVEMSVKERDVACLDANPDLKPNALSQIGKFAWDIRSGHLLVMPVTRKGTELRYGFIMSDCVWYANDGDAPRNRLTVCWRPKSLDGDDLPLPGVATVRAVRSARNELLSRIEDAERGPGDVGSDSDDEEVDEVPSDDDDVGPEEGPGVWVVRADGGKNTATVVANDYTGTEWNELELESCADLDEIKAEFSGKYPDASEVAVGIRASMLNHFLFDMQVGDWVLTPNPREEGTFYYGSVTGNPEFVPVDDDDVPIDGLPCRQRRQVNWHKDHPMETGELPRNAWSNFTVRELRGETRKSFLRLIGKLPAHPQPVDTDRDRYSIDTMLDEGVFMKRPQIARILEQLERKRNLILQGPPGTGKTFLAKRLAYALMGERADGRVAGVQFHQSYSYEDFVGGYRPGVNDDDQLVFKAQDGAFLRLCERARKAPGDRFVMLIDEINRGNLSRVFGELLMLIEPDKRSPEHAVELQHLMARADGGDGKFFVPDNVYIIGTMNLADRSLTGMNVAMRRRFAFAELRPQFGTKRFRKWLDENAKMPKWLRDWITDRMVALNKTIAEDASLGRQYAVGHSFFCPDSQSTADAKWEAWYEAVVEFEIRPLLEEYWFDDPDEADRQTKALTEGLPSERDGDEADSQGAETNEEGDGRLDG